MVIFMTHPEHGAMHVYAEAEAVANEKNGWIREEEPSPDDPGGESTEEKVKRGPGRPRKDA